MRCAGAPRPIFDTSLVGDVRDVRPVRHAADSNCRASAALRWRTAILPGTQRRSFQGKTR